MSVAAAHAFYAALNARDYPGVAALMLPDCPTGLPGVPPGAGGYVLMARRMAKAFPDLRHAVLDCVGAGDKVAMVTLTTGTQSGPFMGHPPGEGRFSARGIDVLDFVDGRIARRTGVFDTVTMLHQLGLYR